MSASRIRFLSIDRPLPDLDLAQLRLWLSKVAEPSFIQGLDYHICSDEHMLEQNKIHLQHEEYTDIITFQRGRPPAIRADILISIDRIRENAHEQEIPVDQETRRVLVHGLLHCLGQGDKSPEEALEMRRKEERALQVWSEQFDAK